MTEHSGAPIAIDPFSFFGITSRIPGLGGPKISHDPQYVFHTPYVQTARGRVSFTVRFHNLQAKRGNLVLHVNMLALDGNTFARLVTTKRVALNRLMFDGSATTIEFEGFRNMSFAVLGQIPDDTDATADSIEVLLNNPPEPGADDSIIEDARSTKFRATAVRQTPFIVDLAPPTFANPVSQSCTASQFAERDFRQWAEQLPPIPDAYGLWREAYILQALRRYGMLERGAKAIGFGVGDSAIPAILARHGLDVTATDAVATEAEPQQAIEAYRARVQATGIADAQTASAIHYRQADVAAPPIDLVNHDLAWSHDTMPQLPSTAALGAAMEAHLRCLRPGGIAVHVLNLSCGNDEDDKAALVQMDIERLALQLISRGHEIARIKFGKGAPSPQKMKLSRDTVPFGLIVRKATSPL